jgi:hypothetical protein
MMNGEDDQEKNKSTVWRDFAAAGGQSESMTRRGIGSWEQLASWPDRRSFEINWTEKQGKRDDPVGRSGDRPASDRQTTLRANKRSTGMGMKWLVFGRNG